MNTNVQGFNYFVPNDLIIPEDPKEMNLILTDYLRFLVENLNLKKIGDFPLQEIQNGEMWFNDVAGQRQMLRSGLRTTINFGTLPNSGTTSVAHNINVTTTTFFTHIYATATDPAAAPTIKAVPIPFVNSLTPGDDIEINVDNNNINITTTTANWTSFSECYVVLEYLQG